MAIPEARSIYEAKLLQLKLLFEDRLKKTTKPDDSNVIPMPFHRVDSNAEETSPPPGTLTTIVDASGFIGEEEAEQVKWFMDYFESHKHIRKAVLDHFFLKILPYTAVME
jgi:hypothetical protein